MSSTFSQQPGTLNFVFSRGDDFSTLVDFSPISMAGYIVSASMHSLVTGNEVQPLTVVFVSAQDGRVNVSLTDAQTAALARGTYGWQMRWTENNATRTALTGVVEVL